MSRKETKFPIIADGETIVGDNPIMNLYDEMDLISNIKGPYQEKNFGNTTSSAMMEKTVTEVDLEPELLPPLFETRPSNYSRRDRVQKAPRETNFFVKTQGQLAREEAREDIKRKKSAAYLRDDKPQPAKVIKREPTVPLIEPKVPHLSRLADKLRQTDYILADMPPVYSLKKEDREQEQGQVLKKNSYDFLKKSQVYNYPENRVQKERQMAQELNLTHIEEEV